MTTVAVMGLGYVGLPLAVAFGRQVRTIGYDVSREKVASLQRGKDPAREVGSEALRSAKHVEFTADAAALKAADFILVAVPTPVDEARQPDFAALRSASRDAGRHLRRGAIVVFESTVYPGATEEICVPELEAASGLAWRQDFHVAYSPERINPGDRQHTLENVRKVIAADDAATLDKVAELYSLVVKAGLHRVSSIAVAEAAKVIENTQRDLNIALMNELALIFNRLGLDTTEVLEAAGTKWNFLPFRPGLVGGHCIGVDPYYLTHKAERTGYHPEVILAGRRINDSMGKYVAEQTVKRMIAGGSAVKGATVNILGVTFKEDCADLRNSKVLDIVAELETYGIAVRIHDPMADPEDVAAEFGRRLTSWEDLPRADALIAAVAHQEYKALGLAGVKDKLAPRGCLVDVKSLFDRRAAEAAGYAVWRL
jgi:UDP-N-acetyl-D-galactosamine dehydrogenase